VRTKWGLIIVVLTAAFIIIFTAGESSIGHEKGETVYALEKESKDNPIEGPLQMEVILERVYLDGEVSQESIEETIWAMEDFWTKYDQWQLVDMNTGYMVFRRQMDDISPLLKANGYFGLTEDGTLTIFNGRPHKTNIIQSFFQIDLGKLESTKCEELKKGIPIMTKDRYVKVLETFKDYSTGDAN
jgi:forespore regulator of the sigma-K checkpoint